VRRLLVDSPTPHASILVRARRSNEEVRYRWPRENIGVLFLIVGPILKNVFQVLKPTFEKKELNKKSIKSI
jgi:hypothetical protein